MSSNVKYFIQHPAVEVNSTCRENYWGSSVWNWRNKSNTDQIFCIRQILEKEWEYNEAVGQLFIDLKNAYVPVRKEDLYNILIELVSLWS